MGNICYRWRQAVVCRRSKAQRKEPSDGQRPAQSRPIRRSLPRRRARAALHQRVTPSAGNWGLGDLGAIDLGNDGEGCLFALGIGLAVVRVAVVVKSLSKLLSAATGEHKATWGVALVGSLLLLGGLIFLFANAM